MRFGGWRKRMNYWMIILYCSISPSDKKIPFTIVSYIWYGLFRLFRGCLWYCWSPFLILNHLTLSAHLVRERWGKRFGALSPRHQTIKWHYPAISVPRMKNADALYFQYGNAQPLNNDGSVVVSLRHWWTFLQHTRIRTGAGYETEAPFRTTLTATDPGKASLASWRKT